ncbi:MAG: porin [Bacteroidetes bacterium MedPE-SWsnd-G2]|nr:MAG: porin [Bacteroidetes bacterium MedPE-SWsnd-G2]
MKLKFTTLVVMLLWALNSSAQTIPSPKFGKGLFNLVGQDSSWTMKIGTRMQFLGIANWTATDGELRDPESSFLIRRARLKFDGYAFSPKLKYKIELGLSNKDIGGASKYTNNAPRYILDGVLKWNAVENLHIWIGQTKLPGNRERIISSANLQQVDRSLLNKHFNIDRDLGIQLHHHIKVSNKFIIREIFAFSQGEGRNITKGNLGGHQYTGKLEFLPLGYFASKGDYKGSDLKREQSPKLSLTMAYDFNNNAVKTRSNQGSYMETDYGFHETNISTLFVGTMFKYKGFSFMGEYANRDADNPIAKNSDGTETGAIVGVGESLNLQSGYLFKKNWEVSGRFTNVNWDEQITGKAAQNQYTFGVSKYLAGHSLKVQSDISYLDVSGGSNELMMRLQMDIHF